MGSHRRRGFAWVCSGLLAAGLLASCTVLPIGLTQREPSERVAAWTDDRPKAPLALSPGPVVGAFLSPGEDGVRRMSQLETWLGGRSLRVGHTYLPGDRWSNIEGQPGFLQPWAQWRRARHDRLLVLNVPMQERNEAGVGDEEVRTLARAGAAGNFDDHFRALARNLVGLKVPDTVIVLGWEMNGSTYTHRCGPDPESWKTYWRRVVAIMRSVPGQKFRFDFAPNRGKDDVAWTSCYPGDGVVDIIGMDTYDQPAGKTFDAQVREPFGLQAQVDFAARHGKRISYPEWGLFRNGDNPEYVRRMLGWFKRHKPLYQTLTDYCPHGVWQCTANPNSAEAYRTALFAQPGRIPASTATARPTGKPAPTGRPADPDYCFPVGEFCIRFDALGDW